MNESDFDDLHVTYAMTRKYLILGIAEKSLCMFYYSNKNVSILMQYGSWLIRDFMMWTHYDYFPLESNHKWDHKLIEVDHGCRKRYY